MARIRTIKPEFWTDDIPIARSAIELDWPVSNPYGKIQKRVAQRAAWNVVDYASPDCDTYTGGNSPIENIFLTALVAEIKFCSRDHTQIMCPRKGILLSDEQLEDYRCGGFDPCIETALVVYSQIDMGGWIVDFLIHTIGAKPKLIVECDGHNFHERTKEQAARDRARDREFQQKGFTVFRFTGSELWHDPCGCVEQVLDWATSVEPFK